MSQHTESQYTINAVLSVGENTQCGATFPPWDCDTPVDTTATIVNNDYSYNTLIVTLQQGCITGGAVQFQGSTDGINWFPLTGYVPGIGGAVGPVYTLEANAFLAAEFNLTAIPYFQVILLSPITGTACGSPAVCGSVVFGYSADSFVTTPPPCCTTITPASQANAPESICVNTTSTIVLAANALRKGLNLTNLSYVTISISFGTNPAILFAGITLAPGGSFWMDSSDFTTATVNAIADAGLAYTDSCCGSPPTFCALLSIQEFQ
jgi:hypothetical protein